MLTPIKPLFLVLILAAVFGAGVFVARLDAPAAFLGRTGAIVSETFGDVFGLASSTEPIMRINLDGGGFGGEENSAGSFSPPAGGELAAEEVSANKSVAPANVAPAKASSAEAAVKKSETPQSALTPDCVFSSGATPNHTIMLNEIAWMGSPANAGETASAAANNEWIELKNVSGSEIDLGGWQILDESENFRIKLDGSILPAGFYLLERTDDDSVPAVPADMIYSGALSNSGMWLKLFNDKCDLVDEIDARSGWLAGDNSTKQTMERRADLGWQTSVAAGGTPKAESSAGQPSASTAITSSTTGAAPSAYYGVVVSMQGDGSGKVTSVPAGINCDFDCIEEYPSGTKIVLTAKPNTDSTFLGWSGPCGASTSPSASGAGTCEFTLTERTPVVASFKLINPTYSFSPPPSPAPTQNENILISEILYDALGSDTGKEFVELYNPASRDIDLSGWSIKKDGTSLATIGSKTEDKTIIKAAGFFLIGLNSYSGTPSADVIRFASLPNTSATVTLYDSAGTNIDSVSYSNSVAEGESYERQPLTESGQFVAQPNPNPQNSGI